MALSIYLKVIKVILIITVIRTINLRNLIRKRSTGAVDIIKLMAINGSTVDRLQRTIIMTMVIVIISPLIIRIRMAIRKRL